MNYWDRRAEQTKRERDGVKTNVLEYPGWNFWVRPSDRYNGPYLAAIARVANTAEAKALVERQTAPDYEPTPEDAKIDEAIFRRAFAEGCVTKWEGVTDPAGAPMEFLPDNVNALLEHFPDIYRALKKIAADPSHFVPLSDDAKKEAIAGNYSPASSSRPARGGKSRKPSEPVAHGTERRPN